MNSFAYVSHNGPPAWGFGRGANNSSAIKKLFKNVTRGLGNRGLLLTRIHKKREFSCLAE